MSAIAGVACFRYLPDLLFVQMAAMAKVVALMLVAIVSNNLFVPGSYPDRWD